MAKGKTRYFKDRQCRYCKLADKAKFRQGRPCCPLLNPRIQNGHCLDREPTTKPLTKTTTRSQKSSKSDNEELAPPDGSGKL